MNIEVEDSISITSNTLSCIEVVHVARRATHAIFSPFVIIEWAFGSSCHVFQFVVPIDDLIRITIIRYPIVIAEIGVSHNFRGTCVILTHKVVAESTTTSSQNKVRGIIFAGLAYSIHNEGGRGWAQTCWVYFLDALDLVRIVCNCILVVLNDIFGPCIQVSDVQDCNALSCCTVVYSMGRTELAGFSFQVE